MKNTLRKFKYSLLVSRIYDRYLGYNIDGVKQYIFVASTGRSGSSSLAKLFSKINGCISFHEPYPVMHGSLGSVKGVPPEQQGQIKVINIKRASVGHDYYMEGNHQFIKHFYADVFDKLPHNKISVICLKRASILSALSFFNIGSIPGITENGKIWLLNPEQEDNIINIYRNPKAPAFLQDGFIRCLWYIYEVYARTDRVRKLYPDIKWVDMQINELNHVQGVSKLLDQLNIPYNQNEIGDFIGIRENRKLALKSNLLDIEKAQELAAQFNEYMRDIGLGNHIYD